MIETFYARELLDSPRAFFAALLVGIVFGLALERAGFGSSRRLAGIFYLRDMSVLKVMFTALVVAMMGLLYLFQFGWLDPEQLYFLPSIFGAQIVGGLIFGVGFAMSGWCPGTAAVGLASGKVDAFIFLGGAAAGSILYNEVFPWIEPLATLGDSGVRFAWSDLGVSREAFAFAFVAIAVGAFWGSEYVERRLHGGGPYWHTPFLRAFSLVLLVAAGGLFVVAGPARTEEAEVAGVGAGAGVEAGAEASTEAGASADALLLAEEGLLREVDAGGDHVDSVELAEALVEGQRDLVLVDLRSREEYDRFHLRGARWIALGDLAQELASHRESGKIVLYSGGMTHAAQARDSLIRLGYRNVRILTDGLAGFIETCLKPTSLRSEPVGGDFAARVEAWRAYFLASAAPSGGEATSPRSAETPGSPPSPTARSSNVTTPPPDGLPGLVDPEWLQARLASPGLRIIDVRPQPGYNSGHIPGSVCVSPEHFRGVVGGVPAMLLPADMIARHLSLLGVLPEDVVVLVPDDKIQDATLVAMALERVGHRAYALLDGGFGRWVEEKRPVDTVLPRIAETVYRPVAEADRFTVDASQVLDHLRAASAIIIDTRPADYFSGAKSDEARAGHMPGAKNRPIGADVVASKTAVKLKPAAELAEAYAAMLPTKDASVIVSCRTAHQASQTYFILKRILGYPNVLWYDGSWTEWSARSELPVEVSKEPKVE